MSTLKDEILRKAMILFLTRGYREVTMKEIQNSVGCSRGVMYHHFINKEQIFEEVVRIYLLPAFSNFSIIPSGKALTLLDAINTSVEFRTRYISLFKEVISDKQKDYYFFKLIFQVGEHYEGFMELVNQLIEQELSTWKIIVRLALKNGEIKKDTDVEFVSQYFAMLPYGLGLARAFKRGLKIEDIKISYMKFYNLIKSDETTL